MRIPKGKHATSSATCEKGRLYLHNLKFICIIFFPTSVVEFNYHQSVTR